MKEKATDKEVKLQFQISKLEEEHEDIKNHIKWLRVDNCKLTDKVKIEYPNVCF